MMAKSCFADCAHGSWRWALRVIILLTLFDICSAVVQMGKLTPEPVAWLVVYHTLAGQSPEWIAAALLLSASTVYKIRGLVFVLIDPSQVVPSCCDGYIPLPLCSFLSHPFSPASRIPSPCIPFPNHLHRTLIDFQTSPFTHSFRHSLHPLSLATRHRICI